jgi:hypothetical protein
MSFLRIAIVLSLGIAVMPADKEQQARLYEQAAGAAHWTATFCDRNATTCDNASLLWATFLKKAEFAGQLVSDVAQRYAAGEEGAQAPASFTSHGTLRPEDLEPRWRGPTTRQGI